MRGHAAHGRTDPVVAVEVAFRTEWGRIVAALIGSTGDWDLAEECAQDAFAKALQTWPEDGVPDRPGAWLTTVARNRAVDRMRRSAVEAVKVREALDLSAVDGADEAEPDESGIEDDRLRLIFTCCHPALALEARVALTLRTLAGLTTAEIARAFLVPEATMAKRLVRAKQKIRGAGIPYRVPPAGLLPQRTSGVLAVLYLLFNEGYSASAGPDHVRHDLCEEAIRLARLVARLLPGEPEVLGLLALMLLQDSRRAARTDASGDLVTLEDQDRSLWDQAKIKEGDAVLEAAAQMNRVGPYQLQAAIAVCHATAGQPSDTEWPVIVRLYERLLQFIPTPVVRLNYAIAVAMAQGPQVGLALVEEIAALGVLDDYGLLFATRADLLRRLGRDAESAAAYREALARAGTDAERRFFEKRLSI
jgi:RNA polymerase sigma-70 factor, ECF subfamily